jgi:DNA-binding transcriptional ArsR family regulator
VFLGDRKGSTTSFQSLASSFFRLAETRLSDTQKQVLRMSHKVLTFHELTLTALAELVSRSSSLAYSTVKWNLRALKNMGLLTGGNLDSKGQRACLTNEARMLAEYLGENLK